jgi:hypothetical protein
MQCVRDWLARVPNQQSVIQRLNKESVKNHRNIRQAGEGGPPSAQGTFAEEEAHQLQHSLTGLVPGVGMYPGNVFTGNEKGSGLSGGVGYPGAPGGYSQAGQHGAPPPPPHHQLGSTQPHAYNHAHAGPPQLEHGGYASSYAPSYSNPATASPSFPSSGPSFPGAGQGGDGFSLLGSDAPPFPGGPPSFPGSGHQGHHGGGGGYAPGPSHGEGYGRFPSSPGGFGGGASSFGFPGADTYPPGSSALPEFPGSDNPSYPYGGGGRW